MSEHDPVIVASELVTGYGFGERLCWEGLLSGRHAFREIERFDASKMRSRLAATVPGLSAEHGGHSLLDPMLDFLRPYASKTYGRTELFLQALSGKSTCSKLWNRTHSILCFKKRKQFSGSETGGSSPPLALHPTSRWRGRGHSYKAAGWILP